MGVDENYNDNLKYQATHPNTLPQKAQEGRISDKNKDLLHKTTEICTLIDATKTSIPKATRNTQNAVSALLLVNQWQEELKSHHAIIVVC